MTESDTNDQGEYRSTAPETSAIAASKGQGKAGAGKKGTAKHHPWRDNIEAVAISIVTIVLFKYFVLEAYKIPTGSMQPTLMGNEETGIYDRVIVDKLSYHYRDPERFEIAVFKYPLDSSKNFIKRIIGMPGERLSLRGGDPWIRKAGENEERILRRPRPIQNAQLRLLETAGEWKAAGIAGKEWTIDAKGDRVDVFARGRGSATFPRTESIRDGYTDGYPKGIKDKIRSKGKDSNVHRVPDLRVATTIEAEADCASVSIVLWEGRNRFRFVIPGPAAPADERVHIDVTGPSTPASPAIASSDVRLVAGKGLSVEVQNLNDLLAVRIGDEDILTLEIPPAGTNAEAKVTLEVEAPKGVGVEFSDVRVWRDIYYTTTPNRQKVTQWDIPEGHYVVLGDNSQDSSDGRDWTLAGFRVLETDEIIRGNSREGIGPVRADTNPIYLPNRQNYEQVFFRDRLGESHVFERDEIEVLAPEVSGLVPRDLVRGRAVLVVWPLAPQHDVYRWKWVR